MSLTPQAARLLSAQLNAELERVAREAAELSRAAAAIGPEGPDATALWAAAGHLQAFYTGMEALLSRVLREVDGVLPTGPDSHQEVLRQAGIAIPGLRPPILDGETIEALGPYRGFRHFFRHAYGVTLRWDKMASKVAAASSTYRRFAGAIESFRRFLDLLAA